MERDESCDARIDEHRARRIADLAKLVAGEPVDEYGLEDADEDDRRERASEQLWEYPLGVSLARVVRVDLSTGGPGDWFELSYAQGETRPDRIVYHFADWFDHAQVTLVGDDFDTVETAFGDVIDGLA